MAGGTRWLDADQQVAWRSYLEATQRVTAAVDLQLQRDAGLSQGEYEILVRLAEAPDRQLRMGTLAEQVVFSRSRLSHAVGRLERAGYVVRRPCPADLRGMHAVLTDAGLAHLATAAPGHVTRVRTALVDVLSPADLATLGRISAELARRLREEEPLAEAP